MERIVLHIDANSFYAGVEQAENPSLKGKPVVVAGKEELRHGIVLTKSIEAKKYGIKTAEALWEARQKCPGLIVLPPDYKLYQRYSRAVRRICYQYSDLCEPFGLDELWMDITGSVYLHGDDPLLVAREISERVKAELGITVSIGVSWNKILAKFGSDHKKPDAITEITQENIERLFWQAPVEELLYVGRQTTKKLLRYDIKTIGDLANASDHYLQNRFGKIGFVLRTFAQGCDPTPVKAFDPDNSNVVREIKSYGNGLTAPHDIICEQDAKALIYLLAESVAQRMREDYMRARTIGIAVRDGEFLTHYTRQVKLREPTATTRTIAHTAWELLKTNQQLDALHPVRALSVRASKLVPMSDPQQLSIFEDNEAECEQLDYAIDDLRRRYGNTCVRRGIEMVDESINGLDIKGENTVHPVSYFHA